MDRRSVESDFEQQDKGRQTHGAADDEMPANLLQIVERATLGADQIAAHTQQIHAAVLSKSKYIDDPNFTTIHPADLELLFAEYDDRFFDGQVRKTLGTVPLHFGLSKRMTSSGGKTAHYTGRANGETVVRNQRLYDHSVWMLWRRRSSPDYGQRHRLP